MKGATRWWLLAAAIVALGALVYHPVGRFEFLNFDDQEFVSQNPFLQQGLNALTLEWALTANLTFHSVNAEYWSPMTLLSRLTEAHLFGMHAGAFHLVSAALHLVNAMLLAVACWALTRQWGRSAFVALLFLVHPQNIEAVCWLSARKDLLSATFFFTTLAAYAFYVRRPSLARYGLLMLSFLCALMAKPMGVSVPLVLMLLDFWPLARWRMGAGEWRENVRVVAEKVPLFILAALAAGLAVVSQRDWNAMDGTATMPFSLRAGNAVVSYFTYLRRLFWPSDLAIFYPHPGYSLSRATVIWCGLVLAALTLLAWFGRPRAPWFFTGWLWFGVVLGPVIGLVQIGGQAMADRYAYPAAVGLLIAMTWTAAEWLSARAALIAGGVAVAAFTVVAMPQVRTWESSVTVFQQALRVTRENALAHLNLGDALLDRNDLAGARTEIQRALEIVPQSALAWNNLARTEALLGNDVAAVRAYDQSLKLNPNQRTTLLYFGRLLKKHERWSAAQVQFERLREIAPEFAQPWQELGEVYAAQGKTAEARAAWTRYLEIRPGDLEVRRKLAELGRDGGSK